MKNKRPLIHFPLLLDSLRQLRLMGGIYLLISIVFSVLPVILIDRQAGVRATVSITEYNFVLYAYIFIAPMTLVHQAFGFLTKRSDSDFYHSLPVTRNCLYLTRLVAVLFILFVTILLSLLSSFVAYALSGVAVNWLCFPKLLLFFCDCALLIASVTLIGITVTGTHFTAFVVSCLLLFLPRFLSTMISIVVLDVAPIVELKELGLLFNMGYNLPIALLMPVLSLGLATDFVGDFADLIININSNGLLYTFLLSLIYIDIGLILHHFRKSETAGRSAPSKVLQHIIRCALALPLFTVLGVLAVTDEFTAEPFWTGVLIALAFLVYFIYELITTKKWRSLLPALYVLPVVLLLGFGIPFAGTFAAKNALNRVPAASEIEYVNLNVNGSGYYNNNNYYQMLLENQEYKDRDGELNALLLKGLEQGIATCNTRKRNYNETRVTCTAYVTFNLAKGKKLTRQIFLSPEDFNRLKEIQASYGFYQEILSTTPDPDIVTGITCGTFFSEETTARRFYETFQQEFDALPLEQKLEVMTSASIGPVVDDTNPTSNEPEEYAFSSDTMMWVTGYFGFKDFRVAYRITPLTPKTLSMLLEEQNERYYKLSVETFAEIGQKLRETDEVELGFSSYGTVTICNGGTDSAETYELIYLTSLEREKAAEVLTILSRGQATSDLSKPFVFINSFGIDIGDSKTGNGEYIYAEGCTVTLSDKDMEALRGLLREAAEAYTIYY